MSREPDEDVTQVAPLWRILHMLINGEMKRRPFKHFFVKTDPMTFNKVKTYKMKLNYLIKTIYGECYDIEVYPNSSEFCVYKGTWT